MPDSHPTFHNSTTLNLHRVYDRIALSVGNGSVFYLTKEQAEDIAACLNIGAQWIELCSNMDNSRFGSHNITIGGKEE